MKNSAQSLIFFTILAALQFANSGCGNINELFSRKPEMPNPGKTRVSFVSPQASIQPSALNHPTALVDTLTGGLMIYAVPSLSSIPTASFYFSTESASSSASATLPNGTYQFYAFGYDAAIDDPSVHVRCGTNGSTVTLDGTDTSIPITLNISNCSDSNFSDGNSYDSTYGVINLQFYGCHGGTLSNGMSTSFCTSAYGFSVGSVQLFLNNYTDLNDTSTWQTAISSGCYATGFSAFPVSGIPRLPQSASNTFMAVTVKAYTDGSCGTVLNTYRFSQGVENVPTPSGHSAYDTPGSPPNPSGPGYLLLQDF